MKTNTKWSVKLKNNHIRKSLTEENDGTRISAMEGFNIPSLQLYSSSEIKTITMKETLLS